MKRLRLEIFTYLLISITLLAACKTEPVAESDDIVVVSTSVDDRVVMVEAESFQKSSNDGASSEDSMVHIDGEGWLSYDIEFKVAGRYKVEVFAAAEEETMVWLEDYYDNKDNRTYNVTGSIVVKPSDNAESYSVEGSPFNKGVHRMKLHHNGSSIQIDRMEFTLMREHEVTPVSHIQSMDGEEWQVKWSDEFEGDQIDKDKWTYDVGDWGWGNNELQYYTVEDPANARIEDGFLVIEAVKDSLSGNWSSARLTTRGKQSFLYGKIEFRAKVPREKGNWAAGWTLGDEYVDELSWPYCGEIDILESVGYEVDNESGDGIAHATVHTPAYYFKINNQISSTTDVTNIAGDFHTYSVEWTPEEVRGYVDGEHYYTYDKNANELEWPFAKPQNIILNLAMGGGWGGAKGMDETVTSQKFVIDYVRVYELVTP